MDYSQLSDFEINKLVAIALGHSLDEEKYGSASIGAFHSDGIVYKTYDYCNSVPDAWQIIVDNEISLNSYSGTWEASYKYDAPIGAFGTDEIVTKSVEGNNPLRTAMIAFLMKREHANA